MVKKKNTLPYGKWIGHVNLLCNSGKPNWGSVATSRGTVEREVRGRLKRERAYVYPWLIPGYICQKPT